MCGASCLPCRMVEKKLELRMQKVSAKPSQPCEIAEQINEADITHRITDTVITNCMWPGKVHIAKTITLDYWFKLVQYACAKVSKMGKLDTPSPPASKRSIEDSNPHDPVDNLVDYNFACLLIRNEDGSIDHRHL